MTERRWEKGRRETVGTRVSLQAWGTRQHQSLGPRQAQRCTPMLMKPWTGPSKRACLQETIIIGPTSRLLTSALVRAVLALTSASVRPVLALATAMGGRPVVLLTL